ncbi:glycoside hydrolase family 1 protein [Latilactobacillus curvatus]|uniref:glycoside hydrolase family 1 protein n=2 Tax=Latilactobacillus curvatus TaxID=28038 RepID=UPI0020C7C266|nr:glycoside hydrolase family 1 protein [Latilactobacillus curvatus]MCP8866592.1 glycoside hydrolase family 1 protein [Latilactobacillus curvatus]MCP8870002.1 glycoside hydrolase family 1 protein [Latilactobacillus curvatus]
MIKFPEHFMWGAATSAPQSEGYSLSYGKSPSTWDKWFEMQPDKFNSDQGPDTASDTYRLYREDVENMQKIGLNSFRTSIAWTRLMPDSKHVNQVAVDFYRDYFKRLRDVDITPIINLFHFDMPWWLMEKGGWETRESVDAFAFYAKTAFELFGDLVDRWTTFNEPIVHIECGYLTGYHYPDIVDFKKAVQVGYHTLMAHTAAVAEFRKVKPDGQIGIILNITPAYAKSDAPEDLMAKQNADLLLAKSFLDPTVLGVIPEELINLLTKHELLPMTKKGDRQLIADHCVDFIGVNYYQPMRVQAPENPKFPAQTPEDLYANYIWPERKINPYRGWEIYPEALYDVAMMMKNDYHNIPWYVSENGMGVADEERFMGEDGQIQDDYRIEFMQEHLTQLHRAIEAGSSCFGYHTWTFNDCWSWLNGYRNRYGFYCVDLDHEAKRTMKKSGRWYRELSENNGF